MTRIIFILMLSLVVWSCEKVVTIDPSSYVCNTNFNDTSFANPKQNTYQNLLDDMTGQGVVGVSMSVYTPQDGMWLGASGHADLRNDVSLLPCNVTRVGSTVKMYTATIIFKLQEEGKLDINHKISDYLTGDYMQRIRGAQEVTIVQMLNHSSGLYNYIQNLEFQTASLNDLVKEWHAEDLLKYAFDKDPYFSPGEDVRYSNTNYILLGLLIEKIENKPLYQVFDEKIIEPLGLLSTQFAGKNPVPNGIIRGYIDIYSNLQVIESTYYSGWDYYTADGGLISNPYDMNVFFRALMSGGIINTTSLNQMLSWKTPKEAPTDFYPIHYGLGIFKIETTHGIAYMHSGDAIGYYANMIYFPDDGTTIVYAVNSNYGKIDEFVSTQGAIDKIIAVVRD